MQTTNKPKKKKENQKPLSLHGPSEIEVLKDILKAPPMPLTKKKKKTK